MLSIQSVKETTNNKCFTMMTQQTYRRQHCHNINVIYIYAYMHARIYATTDMKMQVDLVLETAALGVFHVKWHKHLVIRHTHQQHA